MARAKCTRTVAFLSGTSLSPQFIDEERVHEAPASVGARFSTPRTKSRPRERGFVRQSKAMASQRKPVIVRKLSRAWCSGYAEASFGQDATGLEILDLTGKVLRLPWNEVKWVCYVRDFPADDAANPERLLCKRFSIRPRTPGLWLRMTLTDGEELEGLATNDRSLIEGAGLLLTPPDTRSNTQRIYVPRLAIQSMEVLSLIGAPRRQRANAGQAAEQPELFPPGEPDAGDGK